jgi:hypothetical protein
LPHWRNMMSSDKLHAADLMGKDATVVIETVKQGEYPDLVDSSKKILKPDLYFKGKKKPLGLNSTNARAIAKLLGSPNTEQWVGKAITLYPTVTRAFGEEHECIRIRNRLPNQQQSKQAADVKPEEPAFDQSDVQPEDRQ